MRVIKNVGKAIKAVAKYQSLANSHSARVALGLLGIASRKSFSHPCFPFPLMRRLFPVLAVRPSLFKGKTIYLDPADPSHIEIFKEIVVERVYDLTLVPFSPTHVVDCGGHIGMFDVLARCHYPTVPIKIYEPAPYNCRFLERTVAQLGPIELHKEAISTQAGSASFFRRNSCGGSLSASVGGVVGSFEVKVINFVDVVRSLGPGPLLLKMDIEGEEETLLPAIVRVLPEQCALFFETHSGDESWAQLSSLLKEHGFRVLLLRDRGRWKDGFAVRCAVAGTHMEVPVAAA